MFRISHAVFILIVSLFLIMKGSIFFCLSFLVILIDGTLHKNKSTLILSHVLFRHGDRTPVNYLDNNYKFNNNASYYPYGEGQLNLRGKRRSYQLGLDLRHRYKKFLGDIYDNDIIEAVSSEYGRTQITLQLVLAALFQPIKKWRIYSRLNWQPVEYKYIPFEKDHLLIVHVTCPKVLKIKENVTEETKNLFAYLSEHTGMNVSDGLKVQFIYNNLLVQLENDATLPLWTEKLFPNPIAKVAQIGLMNGIHQHIHTMTGPLLHKILTDSFKKINGTLKSGRKMFMYSGHDINLIAALVGIGNYYNKPIKYAAYMLFELHKIDEIYGIKVYLQNYETYKPDLLHIRNCGKFCPIEDFQKIVKNVYRGDTYCK